jgi:hypothetical protein
MRTNSEIWRDIKGYEGFYQVSNRGDVRSLNRTVGTGIKQNVKGVDMSLRLHNGYLDVLLSKNGATRRRTVHRLVAEAFIPKKKGKEFVNHIDGVKSNNNVENLEWVSRSGNMRHAFSNGLMKNLSNKNVPILISKDGDSLFCNTLSTASKIIGVSTQALRFALSSKSISSGWMLVKVIRHGEYKLVKP